jgi:hypothetical protein
LKTQYTDERVMSKTAARNAKVPQSFVSVNRAFSRNQREFEDAQHAMVMDEMFRGRHYHHLDNTLASVYEPKRDNRKLLNQRETRFRIAEDNGALLQRLRNANQQKSIYQQRAAPPRMAAHQAAGVRARRNQVRSTTRSLPLSIIIPFLTFAIKTLAHHTLSLLFPFPCRRSRCRMCCCTID